MMEELTIDVVSDVACPWCYIGKKRLELALEKNNVKANIQFLPFQLDPTIPQTGMDRVEYFENKFGSQSRIDSIFNRVEAIGETVGINFSFKAIPKIPNTLTLHVLLQKSIEEGFQQDLAAELFEKYMVTPEDLTQTGTLIGIMSKFGWSESKTLQVLEDESLRYQVSLQIKAMQQQGISGVPFFIINKKYGVSGAQPEEFWEDVFKDLGIKTITNDSCDIESGEC